MKKKCKYCQKIIKGKGNKYCSKQCMFADRKQSDFYSKIGKEGIKATLKTHPDHFSKIGKKGSKNSPKNLGSRYAKKYYCPECGKEIKKNSKRCNQCNGIKNRKPKIQNYCLDCKVKISKRAKRCHSCASKISTSMEKHGNWKGGLSFQTYPKEFTKKLREKILKRDNYTCQLCGITNKESLVFYKKSLCTNHIDFNKHNCKENNLNALCCFCNSAINSKRKFFTEYFQAKLKRLEKVISKNIELAYSFKHYCHRNKSQRFWQALRNWSGYSFIYGQTEGSVIEDNGDLEDTFYK